MFVTQTVGTSQKTVGTSQIHQEELKTNVRDNSSVISQLITSSLGTPVMVPSNTAVAINIGTLYMISFLQSSCVTWLLNLIHQHVMYLNHNPD